MLQEATEVIKLQLGACEEVFRSLDGQSKICNWLYNRLLEKANALRAEFIQTGNTEVVKTLYTERGLRNLLPFFKEEHPFLKSVHSSPLKNSALRLSQAIQTYQTILVINDTTLDKPYASKMDLVSYHWSGKHHRVVKGNFNLQSLFESMAIILSL